MELSKTRSQFAFQRWPLSNNKTIRDQFFFGGFDGVYCE